MFTVRKVLADFAAGDWWLMIVKLYMWREVWSNIGKRSKKFSHKELSNSVIRYIFWECRGYHIGNQKSDISYCQWWAAVYEKCEGKSISSISQIICGTIWELSLFATRFFWQRGRITTSHLCIRVIITSQRR